jgi:aryl-alcohol dehydrogenase-like predicted oxidoreductase
MYAWQFSKALYTARRNGWTPFVSMQNHVNLLYREEEREMLSLCIDQRIAVLPWSPLARGRLARAANELTEREKTDNLTPQLYDHSADADRKVIEAVGKVAAARGVPRAQVALAWLLQKTPVTAPIVGASKPEHLTDALAAQTLALMAEEIATLESPYVPHRISAFQ